MKITIEPRDLSALIVSLRGTCKFWVKHRNASKDPKIREYYRMETMAAVRLLRAANGAAKEAA
jgi:hypothetical protein